MWFKKIKHAFLPTYFFNNSTTVRYAFSILFLVAAIVGMATVIGSEQSSIEIVVDQKKVVQGDPFSIAVYAVATTPVNAVSLEILVPSQSIEVLGIDKGESVITLWTTDPRVEGDSVILEGGTYRKGFVGRHLIATIRARAKETGETTILTKQANLLAGDGRGTTVSTNVTRSGSQDLVVYEVAPQALRGEVALAVVVDTDGDGVVTLTDVTNFMMEWTKQNNRYDFNNDGAMSFKDFSILLANLFRADNS